MSATWHCRTQSVGGKLSGERHMLTVPRRIRIASATSDIKARVWTQSLCQRPSFGGH